MKVYLGTPGSGQPAASSPCAAALIGRLVGYPDSRLTKHGDAVTQSVRPAHLPFSDFPMVALESFAAGDHIYQCRGPSAVRARRGPRHYGPRSSGRRRFDRRDPLLLARSTTRWCRCNSPNTWRTGTTSSGTQAVRGSRAIPLLGLYVDVSPHRTAGAKVSLAIQLSRTAAVVLTMVVAWRLTERLTSGSLPAAAQPPRSSPFSSAEQLVSAGHGGGRRRTSRHLRSGSHLTLWIIRGSTPTYTSSSVSSRPAAGRHRPIRAHLGFLSFAGGTHRLGTSGHGRGCCSPASSGGARFGSGISATRSRTHAAR